MNYDQFAHKIEGICDKTDLLKYQITEVPKQQRDLLLETFEQLNNSLEELHVAQEELFQQSEQIEEYHQKLELEHQHYQELFDFAPVGYVVTDTDGKILEANQTASQILAVEKNRLVGKPLIVFIPLKVRPEFRNKIYCLHEQKQFKDWEINLQNYDKVLFDCSLSASIISDKKGNCIGGIRWILSDISVRKQAERKMRFIKTQNYQLQEAAQLKSKIITILSHELRTPLNTILGFSDLLLRQEKNQEIPQFVNIVETIHKNGNHLLKLINNMLDLAKLEEGKYSLNLQPFNITKIIEKITEDLRLFACHKNLNLDVKFDIQDIRIINDPIRLQQLLTNLIDNAIKFTETGSVIVELQELNQDKIVITIRDTGIGISEIDLKYIFQAFRQVNQTMARNYEGTGLGLAIVKDLLDLMGGTIAVESLLGEGSTFRVELPQKVKSVNVYHPDNCRSLIIN